MTTPPWCRKKVMVMIYYVFLPAPRRGSLVKSDNTHTQSSRYIKLKSWYAIKRVGNALVGESDNTLAVIIIIIILKVGSVRLGETENIISSKTPTSHKQPMEGRRRRENS